MPPQQINCDVEAPLMFLEENNHLFGILHPCTDRLTPAESAGVMSTDHGPEAMVTTTAEQNDDTADSKGRMTIIAAYCQRRSQEEGYKECILLCVRRGGRYYNLDIPIKQDDPTLGLDRLRKETGRWWKRYSLYSAIAVQEINVIALEYNPSQMITHVQLSYD
jgi:hypothetical protein